MRLERDPAFWLAIANHPEVRHILCDMSPDMGFLSDVRVYPYAFDHGGYIFVQIDTFGTVFELHSLFTPEGWGREAHQSALEALEALPGWQLITTYRTAHKRSKPPLSFGFKPSGDFHETAYGQWQTWFLTRAAWVESPAFARLEASKCH